MKKKYLLIFLLILINQFSLNAHTIILKTIDNEDGTMEIFGGFSTGASAVGAKLIISSKLSSKIIYEKRVPNSGSLIVQIPKEPYTITLDAGVGHTLKKDGTIKPKSGFENITGTKPISFAFITTLSISIFFILMGIFLSFKRSKTKNIRSF